jgi:hypothetical protein
VHVFRKVLTKQIIVVLRSTHKRLMQSCSHAQVLDVDFTGCILKLCGFEFEGLGNRVGSFACAGNLLNDLYEFHISSSTWISHGVLRGAPTPRASLGLAAVNGMLYIFAGQSNTGMIPTTLLT